MVIGALCTFYGLTQATSSVTYAAVLPNETPIAEIAKITLNITLDTMAVQANVANITSGLLNAPKLAESPKVQEVPAEIAINKIETEDKNLNETKTEIKIVEEIKTNIVSQTANVSNIPNIPFFSQLKDISAVEWRKVGCGIASLAMIIEYYKPGEITVDTLLDEGVSSGAYADDVGWSHQGLALLADNHGFLGNPRDFSSNNMNTAFAKLVSAVKDGPVIASVHYTFDFNNPIPHLVVISGVKDDKVYYNDPASGGGSISVDKFKSSWKKRYIEIQPAA